MKALIDADSLIYAVCWNMEKIYGTAPETIEMYSSVALQIDLAIGKILTDVGADSYKAFIGGNGKTFRHLASDRYKANRGTLKPRWFEVVRHRLVHYWKAYAANGLEAEDLVSINQRWLLPNEKNILCHIDKDLNQVPGLHYNYSTRKKYVVTDHEACANLYEQVLKGDSTDNIQGIPGVGEVKAKKILEPGSAMKNAPIEEYAVYCRGLALQAYIHKFGEREGILKFTENYNLVKLIRDKPEFLDIKDHPWVNYELPKATEENKLFTDILNDVKQQSYFVPEGDQPEAHAEQLPDETVGPEDQDRLRKGVR